MVKPGPLWVAGTSSGGEHSAAEQLEGRFLGRAVPFSPAKYTHTHARTHTRTHTHTHNKDRDRLYWTGIQTPGLCQFI